jgi:putative FmdB family regulatory protein
MPTYEFRCPEGHEFEKFYRSIGTAESAAACPVCGRPAERMMSAAGFAFKGSGFYLTDYGKNAHRGDAPESKGKATSASESSSESAKSDSASADTKAASKSESSGSTESTSAKPEAKKADAKPAEAKPAPTPPKSSSSE